MHYLVHLHVMHTWNCICSSDIDRVEYPVVDGAKCLDWYRFRMIKLRNEKIFSVKIEWDQCTQPKATCNSVYIS